MANGCRGGIVLGRNKFYVFVFEPEIINRFLDEVSVLVANVTELCRGHSNKKNVSVRVTVTGRLQPRVVGMPIDFLFERVENAGPRIGNECCAWYRHIETYERRVQRACSKDNRRS